MKPGLIVSLGINDFKSKYAGSALGSMWALIGPVVTVAIYWFVYTYALKGTAVDGVPYILWLICGIVPWFFFTDGICSMAVCFLDYSFLVRKVSFKSEYLPLIRITSVAIVHLVMLGFAYVIVTVGGIRPGVGQLWILYWVAGSFLLIYGIGKLTSIICVYFRDLAYGLNVIMQLGFWITPIFWNAKSLPAYLAGLGKYNPAAVMAEGYRNAILSGENIGTEKQVVFWIIVIAANIAAEVLMKKHLPTIADRI